MHVKGKSIRVMVQMGGCVCVGKCVCLVDEERTAEGWVWVGAWRGRGDVCLLAG